MRNFLVFLLSGSPGEISTLVHPMARPMPPWVHTMSRHVRVFRKVVMCVKVSCTLCATIAFAHRSGGCPRRRGRLRRLRYSLIAVVSSRTGNAKRRCRNVA